MRYLFKFLCQLHTEGLPSGDFKLFRWKITLSLKVWNDLNKHETQSALSWGVNIFTFVEWNKNKW